MGDIHQRVKPAIDEGRFLVCEHAQERMEERGLLLWQVVSGLDDGRLIREDRDRKPNPIAEIEQVMPDGTGYKAVWSLLRKSDAAILVTGHFFDGRSD